MRSVVAAGLLAGAGAARFLGVGSDISNDGAVSCWATDDTVYTSTSCEREDADACSTYCNDDCQDWCGTACDEGYGALCAFTILSTIDAFCHENVSRSDGAELVAAARAAPARRRLVLADADAAAPATDTDDDADDHSFDAGCDDHAFCEYCDASTMCVYALLEASKSALSVDEYAHMIYEGAGPMAMVLLGKLPTLCAVMSEATLAADARVAAAPAASAPLLAAATAAAGAVAVVGAALRRRRAAPPAGKAPDRAAAEPPTAEDRLLSPAS